MNVKPGVEVASLSDVGCQRENNEDSYLYWEPAGDQEFRRKGRLAVIADGMGGHEGGQEASRLAVGKLPGPHKHDVPHEPPASVPASFFAAPTPLLDYAGPYTAFSGM